MMIRLPQGAETDQIISLLMTSNFQNPIREKQFGKCDSLLHQLFVSNCYFLKMKNKRPIRCIGDKIVNWVKKMGHSTTYMHCMGKCYATPFH